MLPLRRLKQPPRPEDRYGAPARWAGWQLSGNQAESDPVLPNAVPYQLAEERAMGKVLLTPLSDTRTVTWCYIWPNQPFSKQQLLNQTPLWHPRGTHGRGA
eukprot:359956-Chlamydomonas_euryale.AAC.5